MLIVYVSHPWGGKRGNEINADEETIKLQLDYEDVVFVSPIHAIRTGGSNKVDYVDGLAYAIELMRRCDIVYVVPGWRESTGCRAEVEEARRKNIPIVTNRQQLEEQLERTCELTSKMYYQPVRRQYVWNLLEEIGAYHA